MVYKWYILPIGGLFATYHLLGEPETTIEKRKTSLGEATFRAREASVVYAVPRRAWESCFTRRGCAVSGEMGLVGGKKVSERMQVGLDGFLGGGFKYFLFFTPIWGRFPF